MAEGVYKGTVVCTNCGYEGQVDIPKGKNRKYYLSEQPSNRVCPNCGCETLSGKQCLAERRFI